MEEDLMLEKLVNDVAERRSDFVKLKIYAFELRHGLKSYKAYVDICNCWVKLLDLAMEAVYTAAMLDDDEFDASKHKLSNMINELLANADACLHECHGFEEISDLEKKNLLESLRFVETLIEAC